MKSFREIIRYRVALHIAGTILGDHKYGMGDKMKRLLAVIVCSALACGCSIYEAAKAPSSTDYKRVQLNATRLETISSLGLPKITDIKDNKKVDTFQFVDGLHPASKSRIVLYVAGDLFSLGLAEFIFWPLEMLFFDGKKCTGTVSYNANDCVISYNLLDSRGATLWASAGVAISEKSTNVIDK
jgi:hypothetical protein